MAANSTLNSAYLFFGGTLVVAIAAVFLLFSPMIRSIDATQDSITAKTTELAEREEFLQTIDAKIAALQSQQVHEARLNVMLPEDDSLEDVLRIVHEAAAASGVAVNAVKNTSSSAQSDLKSARARGEAVAIPRTIEPFSLSLDVVMAYRQLRSFLQELERAPRLMDVGVITIAAKDQNPDELTGQVEVTFYRQVSDNLTQENL